MADDMVPLERDGSLHTNFRAQELSRSMADDMVPLERDGEQPQQGSFDSTRRFHIIFTAFKLLVFLYFNSLHNGTLSHAILPLYIICEFIYFSTLIKVTGPASRNLMYQFLYIIFGTLASELLLWTSMSLVMWLVINMCLLTFALACLLARDSNCFQEIAQLLDDAPFSEV